MSKLRALVTGATGFVGSNLVRHLLKTGWAVDVIIRPESDFALLRDYLQGIRVHEHLGTSASMQEIVDRAQPDVAFHVASLALSQHRPEDIAGLINSNLLLGAYLVEALSQRVASAPIVNTGTYWQHYEGHSYNPVNLYAATKQAFEDILKYYVEARSIRTVTLKLSDTYGPDDPRPKLLNLLKDAAKKKEVLSMSPGEQIIDLIHVDDVANAFIVAANRALVLKDGVMEDWAVSSGQRLSLRELVCKLESVWGCDIQVRWGGKGYREREVMTPWVGERLPGWSPEVRLEEGLKAMRP